MSDPLSTSAATFDQGHDKDTWNDARVTFTPTGESAREGLVSLAPIDFRQEAEDD